jgi:Zn-dependent protease with chaperone function
MTIAMAKNPTDNIPLSFGDYLQVRQSQLIHHQVNGVPDYAFTLDKQMRQKLNTIKPLRAMARALTAFAVAVEKQIYQMNGVAVGPQQYPEIFTLGEACAQTLGIGIPQMFVYFDPRPNAFTIASDEHDPIIVMTSSLVEFMTADELKFVIGHECGHIHNLHTIYNTMVELMTNPVMISIALVVPGQQSLLKLLSYTVGLFLQAWSRSAEITCDRAGLICCGEIRAARYALAKLVIGGSERLKSINLDEFLRQLEQVRTTPVRLMELTMSHPITAKRVAALDAFNHCETLYGWRPDLRSLEVPRPIEVVDSECEQIISVIQTGASEDLHQ